MHALNSELVLMKQVHDSTQIQMSRSGRYHVECIDCKKQSHGNRDHVAQMTVCQRPIMMNEHRTLHDMKQGNLNRMPMSWGKSIHQNEMVEQPLVSQTGIRKSVLGSIARHKSRSFDIGRSAPRLEDLSRNLGNNSPFGRWEKSMVG